MKKLLFVGTFAALSFASCKKDDNSPSNSQKIVGTWNSSFVAYDANGNKNLEETEKTPATGTNSGTITFNSGGTGVGVTSGINLPFTWVINNNTQIVTTINAGGSNTTNTSYIKTLTSNQLVIEERDSVYIWYGYTK